MSEHVHDWRPTLTANLPVVACATFRVSFDRCHCGAWREHNVRTFSDGSPDHEETRLLSPERCRELEDAMRHLRLTGNAFVSLGFAPPTQ
jgi:hypothetical protein